MITPVARPRAPSALKKVAASVVSFAAIAALLFGLVGLLRAETVVGLVVAGVGLIGGGILLARLSWRLYRGIPGRWRLGQELSRDQTRALAQETARGQWLTTAKFLLALVPVYLLLALLLADHDAALGAAAMVAITSGGLGLLAWWSGRRASTT